MLRTRARQARHLARFMLAAYQPDAALENVIGAIESAHNPAAIRFEPATYRNAPDLSPILSAISKANDCNNATARILYACSFGEFQIMGFNLWSDVCDYTGNLAHYLVDSATQQRTFGAFLQANKIAWSLAELLADPTKMDQFCATYNGNVAAYRTAILARADA